MPMVVSPSRTVEFGQENQVYKSDPPVQLLASQVVVPQMEYNVKLSDKQLEDYLTVELFKSVVKQSQNGNMYQDVELAVKLFQRMKSLQNDSTKSQ